MQQSVRAGSGQVNFGRQDGIPGSTIPESGYRLDTLAQWKSVPNTSSVRDTETGSRSLPEKRISGRLAPIPNSGANPPCPPAAIPHSRSFVCWG